MIKMEPIANKGKSKRIKFENTQSVLHWAYLKRMREHDDTCRVYDINPYIEVYTFRDNLYGLYADNIDGMTDVWMWLTIGPEKAFLIDTGYGLGDTKGLVDMLSGGKELIVVNTHDHFDHAFGNCRFDKVYCHEELVPLLEAQGPEMWDYLFDKETGEPKWVWFEKEDLPIWKPYEIVGVPDHYTWDLGDGYIIELVRSGGHGGRGASFFIDYTNRILFPGDNIQADSCSVGNLSKPIEKSSFADVTRAFNWVYENHFDDIDHIFSMHGIPDIESRILEEIVKAANWAFEDPEHNYTYILESPAQHGKAHKRYRVNVPTFSALSYTYVDGPEPPQMCSAQSAIARKDL